MKENILAVDIGGTFCRLAHFTALQDKLALCAKARVPTAGIHDLDGLMLAFSQAGFAATLQNSALAFAVAGPVGERDGIALTNADLHLDLRRLKEHFGVREYVLVNDFMAQAYGVCAGAAAGAEIIQPGLKACGGACEITALIGAGTGLGLAWLLALPGERPLAVSSEGGHASFAFEPGRETEFQSFLLKYGQNPYVRLDDVLSGRGLCALHKFLTGQILAASEIAAGFGSASAETGRWFSRFYGRACRNWALVSLCRGGLYITGGIAAKNPCLMRFPEFMEEFLAPPQYRELLQTIPVLLNGNEDSGLWGAAYAVNQRVPESQ